LALPYWDYSKSDSRTFPAIFAPRFLDADHTQNPLFHGNRELAFVVGTLALSGDIGEASLATECENFFSDIGSPGFGGDILDSEHTVLGLLEQRPHNDIHLAVGGVVGGNNGAMADVKTAAFDPVFFVHHANIDRMWTEWAGSAGKQWGPMPPDEWLDEQPWTFLDVDGSEQTMSRRFYMERANLAIRYDTDTTAGPALALPLAPVAAAPSDESAPSAGAAQSEAAPMQIIVKGTNHRTRERQLFIDNKPLVVSPKTSVKRRLGAAPTGSARRKFPENATPTLAAPQEALAQNERVQLELVDIRFDRVPSSGFAVYLATASDTAKVSRGTLVGLLDLFGPTHMQMPGMKATQRFDVTRIVTASGGPYTLHVEPYSLFENTSAAARPDVVHIGSVRFVVLS
jgi:tyrosinase